MLRAGANTNTKRVVRRDGLSWDSVLQLYRPTGKCAIQHKLACLLHDSGSSLIYQLNLA
ncbi:hypothetical protein J6590_049101 [Homalodisca vitripennis]|nr:hypothetical protein J6590_049101 [Homalodisca vitripennis]